MKTYCKLYRKRKIRLANKETIQKKTEKQKDFKLLKNQTLNSKEQQI